MDSDPVPARRRFPVGLTIAALVGVAILIGLGAWQLQRLTWKQGVLARVAALKTAPAVPLADALTRAAAGADVDFTRVSVACGQPSGPAPRVFLYAVADGAIAWRPLSPCRIAAGRFDAIAVDRGIAAAGRDAGTPPALDMPSPGQVTGVLRRPDRPSLFVSEAGDAVGGYQSRRAAAAAAVGPAAHAPDLVLVAEAESPPPAGVTPSALPGEIPNNHFAYALTWFGLAAALTGVYFALLFRKAGAR